MKQTSWTSGTAMMKMAATKAQILDTVVQTPNLVTLRTSVLSMEAGQMRTKRRVKKMPAAKAVSLALRNFSMTSSRGGRSWKWLPSCSFSSPCEVRWDMSDMDRE